MPNGRALDVATGTGRNALFLADHGYEVDAVDVADEALAIARQRAEACDVDVNWIRADLDEFDTEPGAYGVITVSFFVALEYLPELKDALAPGGSWFTNTISAPPIRSKLAPRTIGTGIARTICSGRV